MAYKVFTNGSTLQASEVNDNLMKQAVATFSNAAARTAAITTPVEGQVTYLQDVDVISVFHNGSWRNSLKPTGGILQVVSTDMTPAFASNSTSFVDVTGLSVSITPTSTSSRILVLASVCVGYNTGGANQVTLADGSNNNLVFGTFSGSRTLAFSGVYANNDGWLLTQTYSLLHSPNTTSSFTYKVRMRSQNGSNQFINQTGNTTDTSSFTRGMSTITAMEVSA